jgi:hypothetical protein
VLLSLSPTRGPHSPLSEPHSSSDSDLFDDWPEANDIDASVYIALTTYASSSHVSTTGAPHCTQKSFTDGPSTQKAHT